MIYAISDLQEYIGAISEISHRMSDCLLHGFATSHAAQIEAGEGENDIYLFSISLFLSLFLSLCLSLSSSVCLTRTQPTSSQAYKRVHGYTDFRKLTIVSSDRKFVVLFLYPIRGWAKWIVDVIGALWAHHSDFSSDSYSDLWKFPLNFTLCAWAVTFLEPRYLLWHVYRQGISTNLP